MKLVPLRQVSEEGNCRPLKIVTADSAEMVYPSVSKGDMTLPQLRKTRKERFHRLIAALEKRRKSRIFSLIQCGDEHPYNQLCNCTFEEVFEHRKELAQPVPILEIFLHSPGGDADVAYTLIRYFRRRCKRLNIIVPLTAKSAATLMALGADGVYMGEVADLGPIDVQMRDPLKRGDKVISPLDELKSTEFLRDYAVELLDSFTLLILQRSGMSIKEAVHEAVPFTTEIMRPLYEKLDPIEIGEHRRSLAIGEEYANRLLTMSKNPRRKEIVKALISKYPSHSFVIDAAEARGLGLPVHRLKETEERMFLEALDCIRESEDSFYGFSKAPTVQAPVSRKRKAPTPKRPPAAVPGPTAITVAK